mmetsp:Transcript_96237/g.281062  ORF Transcript_96237/g.281062 Transcript_96237/m.281062 type:complete len:419 (+) Transcript_96237:1105-2361(+)
MVLSYGIGSEAKPRENGALQLQQHRPQGHHVLLEVGVGGSQLGHLLPTGWSLVGLLQRLQQGESLLGGFQLLVRDGLQVVRLHGLHLAQIVQRGHVVALLGLIPASDDHDAAVELLPRLACEAEHLVEGTLLELCRAQGAKGRELLHLLGGCLGYGITGVGCKHLGAPGKVNSVVLASRSDELWQDLGLQFRILHDVAGLAAVLVKESLRLLGGQDLRSLLLHTPQLLQLSELPDVLRLECQQLVAGYPHLVAPLVREPLDHHGLLAIVRLAALRLQALHFDAVVLVQAGRPRVAETGELVYLRVPLLDLRVVGEQSAWRGEEPLQLQLVLLAEGAQEGGHSLAAGGVELPALRALVAQRLEGGPRLGRLQSLERLGLHADQLLPVLTVVFRDLVEVEAGHGKAWEQAWTGTCEVEGR